MILSTGNIIMSRNYYQIYLLNNDGYLSILAFSVDFFSISPGHNSFYRNHDRFLKNVYRSGLDYAQSDRLLSDKSSRFSSTMGTFL